MLLPFSSYSGDTFPQASIQREREIEPASALLCLSRKFIYLECRESVKQLLFLPFVSLILFLFYKDKYELWACSLLRAYGQLHLHGAVLASVRHHVGTAICPPLSCKSQNEEFPLFMWCSWRNKVLESACRVSAGAICVFPRSLTNAQHSWPVTTLLMHMVCKLVTIHECAACIEVRSRQDLQVIGGVMLLKGQWMEGNFQISVCLKLNALVSLGIFSVVFLLFRFCQNVWFGGQVVLYSRMTTKDTEP